MGVKSWNAANLSKENSMCLTYREKLNLSLKSWIDLGNTPEEYGVMLAEATSPHHSQERDNARRKLKALRFGREILQEESR